MAGDSSIRVLIIDDSIHTTTMYQKILEQYYVVDVANTIKESFDILISELFDVVILEYNFDSQIDGIEYSNIIRNAQPSTFILMYSNKKNYDMVKRAINEGSIDRFLNKPINTKELRKIINSVSREYNNSTINKMTNMVKHGKAKSVIGSVINQVIEKDMVEIHGVIISKDSIPIYSDIPNKHLFNNFSDTLFAGMISALALFGDELFDSEEGLKTLSYGNVTLLFDYIEDIQICFILTNIKTIPESKITSSLKIVLETMEDYMKSNKKDLRRTLIPKKEFVSSLTNEFYLLLNKRV
ncbi:MAG: Chemotaxis response regulator protein-glutamate methylesterase [Candidatus Heimdallarchaeota archaeon LC_2]|nr:MAG: Chemotaxis response regulator protein-glutamate methylesterase [Candidatus Heimdallarchaeota archaeon LC_2]